MRNRLTHSHNDLTFYATSQTDFTNTCYTISTAGSEGFLRILPVYLDHILNPTMTDAGFTTEIYHLNGEGQDSGVVFSEMQGRENGAMDRMALRFVASCQCF